MTVLRHALAIARPGLRDWLGPRRREAVRQGWHRVGVLAGVQPPRSLWGRLARLQRGIDPALVWMAASPRLPGRCNICDSEAGFHGEPAAPARESLVCGGCRASSRYRSIARGLLRAIWELTGVAAPSLAALPHRGPRSRLAVYDAQAPFYTAGIAYPIPDLLARCRWIDVHTSAHRPDQPWGARLGRRTTNQTLERLTFPDHAFDVVVTSDVMEHVRLDRAAHEEIQRVLRPRGVYLFTVPHFRHARESLIRVTVVDPADPERDRVLAEPEYHGDPNASDGRILSYRAYGTELDETLEALGFGVEYERRDFPEVGIVETELFYCRLGKTPDGRPARAPRTEAAGAPFDRTRIAAMYLRGRGVEIGGLHRPMRMPDGAVVRYVDRLTPAQLALHYPDLDPASWAPVDLVADGETLAPIADESLDFVVANHFLEHCEDPIGAVGEMLRTLRPGGVLFLAVPDKRHTFDRARPVTPLAHLVRDHADGPAASRWQHFEEYVRLVHAVSDPAVAEAQVAALMAQNYSIHFHVWTQAEVLELLAHLRTALGLPFEVELVHWSAPDEVVVVLRKVVAAS